MATPASESKQETNASEHVSMQRFLAPYYILNSVAVLAYPVLRIFISSDKIMARESFLKLTREQEIFGLVGVMLALNLRKKPTLDAKIALYFMYLKAGILAAALYLNKFVFGGVLVCWLAMYIGVRQPLYSGPTKTAELTPALMTRIMRKGGYKTAKKNVSWLVFFYATWNDACVSYDAAVAELSLEYSSETLQIGKMNLGKHKGVAKTVKVDDDATSFQLPSFILYQNGKEVLRVPQPDANGKYVRMELTQEQVAATFDLQALRDGKPSSVLQAAEKKDE